jgi:3-phosphoshikimate 1-carboxyvinyltransferase
MAPAPPPPERLRITGGGALVGELATPGDKSISHRALILAALAEGWSELRGLSNGEDVARTEAAVRTLGAQVEVDADGARRVRGGRARLHAGVAIDCGNSGTSLRLLAGVTAGLPGESTLSGDDSLSARPMDRIADPLRAMGAGVVGRGDRCLPPVRIAGGALRGIEWTPAVASAQVKSCILLAGLDADGPTVVRERVATRAHTEEMLAEAGADIDVEPVGAGRVVRLRPSALRPLVLSVPGDPSQAAFWLVAACILPGSRITVRNVYVGPDRIGYLRVLERMGASIELRPTGHRVADLTAAHSALVATDVEAAEIPSLDEVPILSVAAALARGTTRFREVGELRVKESDRLSGIVAMITGFGGAAEASGDTLAVEGLGPFGRPATGSFHSGGDHRLAMAATVLALAAPGTSMVAGFASVATSYPGFLGDLGALAGAPVAEDAHRGEDPA